MKLTGPIKPGAPARLLAALAAALLVEGAACMQSGGTRPGAAGPPPLAMPRRVGRIAHPRIKESSGIVASRKHAGVYWTINDSGNSATIYAIDATGKSLGEYRLTGARNVDWEDIAADAAGKLYVADVGNNNRRRKVLTIYTLAEPDPRKKGKLSVEGKRRFRYPRGHGPFDCEAMFVRKGWAYLITKDPLSARLYRVRLGGPAGEVEAEYLGPMPQATWITGADISPDGRRIAAVSYTTVYVYNLAQPLDEAAASSPSTRPIKPRQAVRAVPQRRFAPLHQAEAICWIFGPAATELLITNEQREIYHVRPVSAASVPSAPVR